MGKIRDNSEALAFLSFLGAVASVYFEIYPLAVILVVTGAIALYSKSVDREIARLDKRIDEVEGRNG